MRCDQTVRLTTPKSSQGYPDPLRRVKFYDGEHDKRLGSEASLYTILQILSLTLVEKTPLDQLLANSTLKMENLKHLTNWIYSLKCPDTSDFDYRSLKPMEFASTKQRIEQVRLSIRPRHWLETYPPGQVLSNQEMRHT